jgi:sugar O-acyltransferase (sialic acid O-acetyltransferase NeuD family)
MCRWKRKNSKVMRDLIIYGAGGFGRETALMIKQINKVEPQWKLLGFCDDGKPVGEIVDGLPVLGGLDVLQSRTSPVQVVLAVADPVTRKAIRTKLNNPLISFPALAHPSVIMGEDSDVRVGDGSIICAGSILTTNILIGEFVIVNLACTIGHDVTIGPYSSLMPGVSISGFVQCGESVLVGTGARILPHVHLGGSCQVGAGAVVTKPVNSNVTVVGIPAKPLEK